MFSCASGNIFKFKHEDSSECSVCAGVNEDAEYVFFICFSDERFRPDGRIWLYVEGMVLKLRIMYKAGLSDFVRLQKALALWD